MSLLEDARQCTFCERFGRYGFVRPPQGGGFYKFPATIGAIGNAPLLFIGINPRRSPSNQLLCDEAMDSLASFGVLASNREPHEGSSDGARYIRRYGLDEAPRYGKEPHYRQHLDVVERVWEDDGANFEDHAVATELYLCSTVNTEDGDFSAESPCAGRFFVRVVQQVQPEVIVTLGAAPRDYLRKWPADRRVVTDETLSPYQADIHGHPAWVFDIPHVQDHVTTAVRTAAMNHAITGIKHILRESAEPDFLRLGTLFPPRRRGSASRGGRAVDVSVLASARERLDSGQPFSDDNVYPIYDAARPDYRPRYRAYLAAWDIREALGYDKSRVSISTEVADGGYTFTIAPKYVPEPSS